ncbi:hypothetical protein [Micromonospora sp. WMMD1274]|uniref:hypothetical protein n=1 Tax=Micromonospora sp. WMMD1274 TaxID=3404116 RepID=UPI001075BF4C
MSAALLCAASALFGRLAAAGITRWLLISYATMVVLHTSHPDRRATTLKILELVVPGRADQSGKAA